MDKDFKRSLSFNKKAKYEDAVITQVQVKSSRVDNYIPDENWSAKWNALNVRKTFELLYHEVLNQGFSKVMKYIQSACFH